jgi:hypothetical protein
MMFEVRPRCDGMEMQCSRKCLLCCGHAKIDCADLLDGMVDGVLIHVGRYK